MTLQQAQIIHKYGDFLYGVEIIEDFKPEKSMMPIDVTTAIKMNPDHLIKVVEAIKNDATQEELEEISGVLIAKLDINVIAMEFNILIY